MKGMKYKQVSEICNDMDRIIKGDIKKADYKYPSIDLNYALKNDCNYGDIALVCDTVLKMAKTKNRVIRHLEKDFGDLSQRFLFTSVSPKTLTKKK